MTDKHRLLYIVTARPPEWEPASKRYYSFKDGNAAKAFLAYCHRNGVEAKISFSGHETFDTAKADIDRQIRLAGQRLYP